MHFGRKEPTKALQTKEVRPGLDAKSVVPVSYTHLTLPTNREV